MIQLNLVDFAVRMFDFAIDWLSWGDVFQAEKGDFIGRLDLQYTYHTRYISPLNTQIKIKILPYRNPRG